MPGYDDPNRPEWTGKRKAKNFARINAACKGLKTSGGKPPTECPKCGTSHKFAACPVCGCPRPKTLASQPEGALQENLPCLSKTPMSGYLSPPARTQRMSPPCSV